MGKVNLNEAGNETFMKFLFCKTRLLEFGVYLFLSIVLMFLYLDAYPFPIINGDSGNYILRAREMSIGAYRPYGYSVFLSKLHGISTDIRVVFFGQYALNFMCTIFFLFSIQFLFSLKRVLFYFFAFVMVISPGVLYVSTLVMSDSLFYSLSLLFLTTGLWMVRLNSRWWVVLIHLLVLYFLLYTRYVALVYPFASVLGLMWGKFNWKRLALAITPLLVMVVFYTSVKDRMEAVFNIEIFSGFGGWAMANNAVSVVPYVDLELHDIKDPNVRYVHSFVIQQPDSLYKSKKFINTTQFMWGNEMPAKQMLQDYKKTRPTTYPKLWLYTGQMLNEYAIYLIEKYPFQYFKHFILPNTLNLFKTFEIKEWETFSPLSLEYFEYPVKTYTYNKPLISRLYTVRLIATTILWGLFFAALIYLIISRKAIQSRHFISLLFLLFFIVAHCFMSVVAHPINNFRYLMPIYPLLLLFVVFGTNQLLQHGKFVEHDKAQG